MSHLARALLAATLYTTVGLILLCAGAFLVDLLTAGGLRRQIWVERNRNAAIVLSSALAGIGAIVFTAILTTYDDLTHGLVSTVVFAALGLVLMAAAFWVLDLLTPGQLRDILVDPQPHPAVWVTATANIAVAAIISAAIS